MCRFHPVSAHSATSPTSPSLELKSLLRNSTTLPRPSLLKANSLPFKLTPPPPRGPNNNVDDDDIQEADELYRNKGRIRFDDKKYQEAEEEEGEEEVEVFDTKEGEGKEEGEEEEEDVYESYLPDGSSCSLERKISHVSWRTTWEGD